MIQVYLKVRRLCELPIICVQILLRRGLGRRGKVEKAGKQGKWDCLITTVPIEYMKCSLYINIKEFLKEP